MIEALGQWLQSIVIIVLLATFLDMILPNSSMHRYVKLVMGLLILLAILTPILQIFKSDVSVEKLATKLWEFNGQSSGKSLQEIKSYGEKLMKQNQDIALSYVQEQMQSLIKSKVEEEFGVKVKSVMVTIVNKEKDKEQAYPVISSVQLILDKDKPGQNHYPQQEAIEIQPIEPVTISVIGESETDLLDSSSPNLTITHKKLLREIVSHISSTWSIDQDKIIAKMEEERKEG